MKIEQSFIWKAPTGIPRHLALVHYYDDREHETMEESDSNVESVLSTNTPSVSNTKKTDKKSVIKSTGNVRTLSSLKHEQDSGESSEDEGQAFYAGGSEHSGQQVLGPSRGRRSDIISEMFRSVREFGAEVVETRSSDPKSKQSRIFSGTGYRLGETGDDSEVISSAKSEDSSQVDVTLKFWKNGFSVNDGPLRSYDDPKGQEFLHHIKHGEVPNELIMQAQGREISFNMEDYRHAEYASAAPKTTFTGTGQKLGRVTPTLSPPLPINNSDSQDDNDIQTNPIKIDDSQPTTNIQIRLADGSRLVGTFNYNHTINDLRRYIEASSPQSRRRSYTLLSSFPRKELVKNDDTIEQTGLINAVVMQHFIA
ncbi:hypothetical protein PGB90_010322 [Kerria lacca]